MTITTRAEGKTKISNRLRNFTFTGKTVFSVRADLTARENLSSSGTNFTLKSVSWSSVEELLQVSQFVGRLSFHQRKYASALSNSHCVKKQSCCHKGTKRKKKPNLHVTNALLKEFVKANSCLLWQVTLFPQVQVFLYVHINLQDLNTGLLCSWT